MLNVFWAIQYELQGDYAPKRQNERNSTLQAQADRLKASLDPFFLVRVPKQLYADRADIVYGRLDGPWTGPLRR